MALVSWYELSERPLIPIAFAIAQINRESIFDRYYDLRDSTLATAIEIPIPCLLKFIHRCLH